MMTFFFLLSSDITVEKNYTFCELFYYFNTLTMQDCTAHWLHTDCRLQFYICRQQTALQRSICDTFCEYGKETSHIQLSTRVFVQFHDPVTNQQSQRKNIKDFTDCKTGQVRRRHNQHSRAHNGHQLCDKHMPCTDLHPHTNWPTFTLQPTYTARAAEFIMVAGCVIGTHLTPTYIHIST